MKKTDKTIIENQFKAFDNMLEGVSVYKLIFNDIGEAIDAELEYMNPTTVEAMDLNPEDAIGKNATELFSPDYLNPVFQSINEFLTTGKFKRLELYYPPTDKYFIFSGFDIPDNYFAVIRVDITEQKKADEKLIAAEKNYHLVADFTYDWEEWRDNKGKLKYVSPSCKRITGYSKKEFMENSNLIFNIIYPDDLESYKKHRNVHFSNSNAESIQFRIISRDKNIHWIEHICQPVYDDDGRFMGRRASNRDITERKKTEDALKSSQQMLENVLENFPGVVFWKDLNSVYLGCNKNFSRGAGLAEPSEIIGKSDFDQELPWKNEAELYRADDLQVIESGIPQLNIIETLRQVDGHVAWFDTNKVPLRDHDGNVIGVIGTSNDITERKKLEEELKKRAALLDVSYEAIFSWDYEDGILSWNQGAERLYKYGSKEAIGLNGYDLLKTNFPLEFSEFKEKLANDRIWTGELVHTTKEGKKIIVESHMQLIQDTAGKMIVIETNRDITERKKAEEALRKSEQWFRSVVDTSPSLLVILNAEGKIQYFSPNATEMTGYTPEEIQENIWIVHSDETSRLQKLFDNAFATGEGPKSLEFKSVKKNGDVWWVSFTSKPIKDEKGEFNGFVVQLFDITERKKAEEELRQAHDNLEIKVKERTRELEEAITELERSNEELESFAHITSHDLQEPLRSVASYAQLIQRRYGGQLDSDADEFIDFMVSGATRMKGMIQGLLDYSRVNRAGIEFVKTDMNAKVEKAVSNLQYAINESSAEITHDNLPNVIADPDQMVRVFQNLIGNAIKFKKA